MSGDLGDLAGVYERFDPMPDGLVARMQRVARSEVELASFDLDLELLELVERTLVPVGARGSSSAYTLRFAYEQVDLLVRVATDDEAGRRLNRLDGWLVPPVPISVRVLCLDPDDDSRALETAVDGLGRFEFSGVPTGMVRLLLTGDEHHLATPAFEI